ncbi:MAG: hypothetical protein AAF787_12225 [Chloroflexota bacterium]
MYRSDDNSVHVWPIVVLLIAFVMAMIANQSGKTEAELQQGETPHDEAGS